jgi:hypothetical protein
MMQNPTNPIWGGSKDFTKYFSEAMLSYLYYPLPMLSLTYAIPLCSFQFIHHNNSYCIVFEFRNFVFSFFLDRAKILIRYFFYFIFIFITSKKEKRIHPNFYFFKQPYIFCFYFFFKVYYILHDRYVVNFVKKKLYLF